MDIKDVLEKMTLKEKVSLLFAADWWNTKSISRLNIDSIKMSDGPHGLRNEIILNDKKFNQKAVCFPPAALSACSFDPELIEKMGEALASEAIEQNVDIILGPGTNIKRSPLCGRNFEYFSEDPYLAGMMSASFIKGVQNQGVGTSIKHFAANNQETYRAIISAEIDERTLHEIYLKPFEIAIKQTQPWTVMCSYNRLNGVYASQNKYLLTDVLRDFWGYKGAVISDWGAVDDRAQGVKAGLDIEFPYSGKFNYECVLKAVLDGEITTHQIDCCVLRILELISKVKSAKKTVIYNQEQRHLLAKKIAQNSIILLKNDDRLLPFCQDQKLLVIGALAKYPRYQGSGSSKINPFRLESFLDGLNNHNISYEYLDGYNIDNDVVDYNLISQAVSAAKAYKNIVVFIGLTEEYESEGYDRKHMRLPQAHYSLIDELLKVRSDFVVALSGGSPVELDNIIGAKSIVLQYLTGEAADAGVDILFGSVNPSGKLAETWPIKLEDNPSYPNFTQDNNSAHYKETLFVGYRYYDTFGKNVSFPFGYGLSYTSFELYNFNVKIDNDNIKVNLTIKNTGDFDGAEVVQVYIGMPQSNLVRPKKELKAFEKVFLKKGETKEINLSIPIQSLAFYNTSSKNWTIEGGEYKVFVGVSSKDIAFEQIINIKGDEFMFSDYVPHKKPILNDEEFSKLLKRPLTPKTLKKQRPYDFNSTIEDISKTIIGRVLKKILAKKFNTLHSNMPGNEQTIESVIRLPFRMLAMLSEGMLPKEMMMGLIDLANHKYIKGLKKLIKSRKGKW
ncbi:MAG TPA: glycosyl hydrolase [Clostridiales bacterium]|nr:glycosyl hydrolase [Clostridiales bacterium]